MKLGLSEGPLVVGAGSIPGACASLWKPLSYGHAMLNLSQERGLILSQLNVLDFCDSPLEPLLVGRSGWEVNWRGGKEEGQEDGWKGKM